MTALGDVPLTDPISDYLGGSDMTALGDIPLTDDIEDYAGAAFPSSPVAGMLAWYSAADVASLTITSQKVSAWNDKSGNGVHLAQATAGNRPLYSASPRTINGITIPEFVGPSNLFMDAASATWNADRTSTAIALVLNDIFNTTRRTVVSGTGDSCNQVAVSNQLETTKPGVAVLAQGPMLRTEKPVILAQRMTGTTIEHFVDGQLQSFSESSTFTSRNLRLGAHFSGEYFDGLIAEVILYGTTLSDADLNAVFAYLQGVYAVPW